MCSRSTLCVHVHVSLIDSRGIAHQCLLDVELFFSFRWSAEFGAHRNGSPELHVMLAEYIYSESPEPVGRRSKFAISYGGWIALVHFEKMLFLLDLASIFEITSFHCFFQFNAIWMIVSALTCSGTFSALSVFLLPKFYYAFEVIMIVCSSKCTTQLVGSILALFIVEIIFTWRGEHCCCFHAGYD